MKKLLILFALMPILCFAEMEKELDFRLIPKDTVMAEYVYACPDCDRAVHITLPYSPSMKQFYDIPICKCCGMAHEYYVGIPDEACQKCQNKTHDNRAKVQLIILLVIACSVPAAAIGTYIVAGTDFIKWIKNTIWKIKKKFL